MSNMDNLLFALLKRSMDRKCEVSPLTIKISLSPIGLSSGFVANKKVISELHAEEWLKETTEILKPIMEEQTDKFTELFKKRFNLELRKVDIHNAADVSFQAFMEDIFVANVNP